MKQGKHYTTVILWILLIAIAAYFGYSVVTSIHQPLTTATVMEYEAGSGYYAAGFVVRDETVIESEYGITVLTAKEGARVAAGEPVATGYLTGDAQDRQSRITELTSQLEQLNYAYRSSSSIADQAALDSEIVSDLTAFSRYVSRRDMNSIADLSPELKGLVLRRSSDESATTVIAAQITATQNELESLRSEAEQDTRTVAAPSAGYFSGTVDGYESVLTPKRLDSLSVQDYNTLEPETIPEHTAGKLISGNTWYYVTAVPSGELGELAKGDRVKVTFARDFYDEIEMTVSRISENQAGFRLLVLSCDRYMQNVTLLRQQSADIVFVSHAGLRVPKSAVHVDKNSQPGVYVLEGATAVWKPIQILHDNGESYVVELDRTSTSNLWPGDEAIVGAKNLYDGKVVG